MISKSKKQKLDNKEINVLIVDEYINLLPNTDISIDDEVSIKINGIYQTFKRIK